MKSIYVRFKFEILILTEKKGSLKTPHAKRKMGCLAI